MVDQEQVELLKRSVQEWNTRRRQKPNRFRPDLSGADLRDDILIGADLSGVDLSGTNLSRADLNSANLSDVYLHEAILSNASLSSANLSEAILSRTILHNADLSGANLTKAYLHEATLSHTDLDGAIFTEAHFYYTTFAWIDLSEVSRLDTAKHDGPSTVNINSVILPHDKHTRLHFLRGVGFTETQIEYLPSLLTPRPIQYCSLFISYAHQDEAVAKQLYRDLRKSDVPCWFAPHDLRPGTPILRGIEEAIHIQDKFLLILSEHSVNSRWIEREVDAALYQEIKRGQDVLFPIRLDNAILESNVGWATRLQYRHIGDFTNWRDDAVYQDAFTRLLQHLKVTQLPTNRSASS